MLVEILVDLWILDAEIRAEIDYLDTLLQQRHGKLGCNTMRKRQKGELDAESGAAMRFRIGELLIRQRRVTADPTKNFGGLFSGVLTRSEAPKFDQRMLGQALHKFLARITACSNDRDFRFLHDVCWRPRPEEILQYTFGWLGENPKLKTEFWLSFPSGQLRSTRVFSTPFNHVRRPEIARSQTANDRNRKSAALVRACPRDRHPPDLARSAIRCRATGREWFLLRSRHWIITFRLLTSKRSRRK